MLELFILLLTLLIAYNAAAINTDERRRDHATLFAFGVPLRRVLRMDLVEGILLGFLGTTAGIAGGLAVLGWVTTELMGNTMPDLGLHVALSNATIATAVALGVIAVAAAPLLTVRRLRRMDIPGRCAWSSSDRPRAPRRVCHSGHDSTRAPVVVNRRHAQAGSPGLVLPPLVDVGSIGPTSRRPAASG